MTPHNSTESDYGACGLYIWTGTPVRSAYGCFSSATVISLLDQPQYILDASRSSTASRSKGDGAVTATSNIGTNVAGSQTSQASSSTGSASSSRTGAIVGGVVGGVAGVALIGALAAYLMMRHKKKKAVAYNAVPLNEQAGGPPAPGMAPMPYPYHPGPDSSMSFAPSVPTTIASYPPGVVPDPLRSSYVQPHDSNMPHYLYDPAKQTVLLHPGATTTPGVSPPHSPSLSGYQYRHSVGSSQGRYSYPPVEMDSGAAPAGHASNPVEIGSSRGL